MNLPAIAYFKARHRVDENGCWRWLGFRSIEGYGVWRHAGRKCGAHRATYELFVGQIPPNLQLDHLCRVRDCVNPNHLEPVTSRENNLRGMSLSAINSRKRECNSGHPFTPENTRLRITKKNRHQRICRACHRRHVLETKMRQQLRAGKAMTQ